MIFVMVAKLINMLYNMVYIYYKNFNNFKKLISFKFAQLNFANAIFIYTKDVNRQI